MNEELKQNKIDVLASTARSIVGIAPFVGPLLTEIVDNVIPNQKIDRLTKFVIELEERFSHFEKDFVKGQINNENFTDLLEEGLKQASRAISDDRKKYIASIIENGLEQDQINFNETKYIMQLLEELNDIEIIWLRYYLINTLGGDEEFREKHKAILDPVRAYIGADQATIDKDALQNSYKEHLVRLKLIKPNYSFDNKTGQPEYDKFTKTQKIAYYSITSLGKLLLRYIGLLVEDE